MIYVGYTCAREAVVVSGEAYKAKIWHNFVDTCMKRGQFKENAAQRPYLSNVGREIWKEVSKGAVVGPNDELHEDTACHAAQPSKKSESENKQKSESKRRKWKWKRTKQN